MKEERTNITMAVPGKFGGSDNGLFDNRGIEGEIGSNGVVGKSGAYIEGNDKEDFILREHFVLAFIELSKLEEKTGSNFAVKSGGRIAMKVMIPILPKKNDLGEEEGD